MTLLLGGAGCKWLAQPMWPTPAPEPALLPQTVRTLAPPDTSALGEPVPTERPDEYYHLSADECRRLAAANSSLANLIESSVLVETGPLSKLHGSDCAARIIQLAAAQLSREARNRTAAASLDLYYQLLELELTDDVLEQSLTELDELVKFNDTLREKGFKESDEVFALQSQQLQLQADQAQLRAGLQRLNTELKSLLAIDPGTPGFLLPADQVRVVPETLEMALAIEVGLTERADLQLLRELQANTDYRTVAAVKRILVGVTPLLGGLLTIRENPVLLPFVSAMAKAEACQLQQQLQSLLADREREAAKEIRTAVNSWGAARDQVAILRKKFALGQGQVDELDKKRTAGMAVEFELRKARLDLLKTEAELIKAIAAWKRADVKAREAIGLLGGE
jgi:outer membrane protein TolC